MRDHRNGSCLDSRKRVTSPEDNVVVGVSEGE